MRTLVLAASVLTLALASIPTTWAAEKDQGVRSDGKPSKLPSQDLRQKTPFPYNIELPPVRPKENIRPNTMQPSISAEARANALGTMMASSPFSLREMVAMMVIKYEAKPGLTFDDVVEAMKVKANEINFKYVGVNPLWKDVIAVTGQTDTPRVEFYSFCDSVIARQILDYSLEFAAFLPCRVAVVEDADKKIWVVTLDWDVRWIDTAKNPNKISNELRDGAIRVREALDKIMRAGALGEF